MNKYIEKMVNAYTLGLITQKEMINTIAKEYAKLWARGQILAQITK